MKSILLFIICLMSGLTLWAQNSSPKMDSLSYSLGVLLAQNLKQQGLDKVDIPTLSTAMQAALAGDSLKIDVADANSIVQDYVVKQQSLSEQKNKEAGKQFLAENGKRSEVTTLESGLQYEVLKTGTGAKPKASDQVQVHYHGTLMDGTVFDSSVSRGQPASFGVTQVIPGWVEALQLMSVGDKWKLVIPSDLAYGARGAGGQIGPHATLVFEVELLGIK